jgi:hypothetical protein
MALHPSWFQHHPLEAVVGVFPKRSCHFAFNPQHEHTATLSAAPGRAAYARAACSGSPYALCGRTKLRLAELIQ